MVCKIKSLSLKSFRQSTVIYLRLHWKARPTTANSKTKRKTLMFGKHFSIAPEKLEQNAPSGTWPTKPDKSNDLCPTTPGISTVLSILLTMPASTATSERYLTVMRRVKHYLRATMRTERMKVLALMHVYRDVNIDIDPEV
ncbi:hypothetical protein MAR_006175, partial [Mya arenaria]